MLDFGYTQVDVPANALCDCNYAGYVWLQDEKHHWASLAAGLRYYVNPSSHINFFVDANLRADWFMAVSLKQDERKRTKWDAFGYRRFAPSMTVSLGAKWDRLSASFGYETNIARTFTRDAGTHDQVLHPFKTGFWTQGVFGKIASTAFRVR